MKAVVVRGFAVAAMVSTLAACRPRLSFHVAADSYVRKDDSVPAASPIYDRSVIHLRGVRGETLGVQILGATLKDAPVHLELNEKEVATVTSFVAHFSTVKEPSTAMYGPSRGKGRYADALEPNATPRTGDEPIFFDVAISSKAWAGKHLGALTVGPHRTVVELTVEPITIDLEASPSTWVYYMPKEIAIAHGLADDDSAAELALERKYHALFRAHGALLASDLPPARFSKRREFLRGARYFPIYIDSSTPARIEADVHAWLDLFAKEQAIPFAIPVDEPNDDAARARAKEIALAIGRAGGGAPKLLRAVTAKPHPGLGDAFDVFISPTITNGPRRWTYNGRPPDAGSMIVDAAGTGTALRARGWLAERYHIELWYIWDGLYFTDRYNGGGANALATDSITFDERRGNKGGEDFGNGDGVLVHPGPLPTLRLKALRRGISDRLLLQKLAACGGDKEASEIVGTLVPRGLGEGAGAQSWPADEGPFEIARGQLLDALVARCKT